MIPDWDTNTLFVSDRLEIDYPTLFGSLRLALDGVTVHVIPGTSAIWCRDYMPIQIAEKTFCQFRYDPDYLEGYPHLVTPPDKCRLPFMEDYRQVSIILDGGNVVASRTKVILTNKVYKENPTIRRPQLRRQLEQLFQA
jgi:agmatine deiminase